VIFPELCLAGGGIVAAAAIFYFVVACEPAGGGSDVMLVLVLAGLGASDLMPVHWMRTVVWWCLAVNVCLAYWWSGVAKTRVPAWRAGRQMALALNSPRYGSAAVAREFLDHHGAARAVSWSVIGLEAACPVFLAGIVGLGRLRAAHASRHRPDDGAGPLPVGVQRGPAVPAGRPRNGMNVCGIRARILVPRVAYAEAVALDHPRRPVGCGRDR
jgi:hypothetical protein